MYEERREKFSFRSFFLTILLVLLFVFLMLWLFPTKWDVKDLQSTYDLERLSVLYDEIFANNVSRMKDAAIGYFTNERMPKKIGETKKLTLQQMYDLHLVLKMKDKDGKACDAKKSYVEMTKYTDEYRLKVNLSCGDYEDYIIVYLGCYDYCDGICEKRVETTPVVNTTPQPEVKPDPTPQPEVKPDPTPQPEVKPDPNPEPVKYYCKVVSGKYYDKAGNVVSKAEYEKSCNPEPVKYYCKVVSGKYYNKAGNVVSKAEYEKSCNPEPVKYYCKVVSGKYYNKAGNVVSKAEYEKSCNPEPVKYYCKVVSGKYYDKAGNVVSKAEYEKSCNPEPVVKKYMYEYKLVIPDKTTCTAWSAWGKTKITATNTVKVETKVENEIVSYKTTKVQTGTKTETIVTGQKAEKYVSDYLTELVVVDTKQVKVGTTTKQVTEKVQVGTVEKYVGIGSGSKVPSNTSTKIYKVISTDKTASCSYCEDETKYTWEIWNIEPVYDVVTKTETVPVYKTVNVYGEKTTPVYSFRMVDITEEKVTPIYKEVKVPVYGDVTYYRQKTCTVKKGSTDIKWSSSNTDASLIGKGYKLTGNVKEV